MKDNIEYYDFNPAATDSSRVLEHRAGKYITEWAMVIGYDSEGCVAHCSANPSRAEQLLLLERVKKLIIEGI